MSLFVVIAKFSLSVVFVSAVLGKLASRGSLSEFVDSIPVGRSNDQRRIALAAIVLAAEALVPILLWVSKATVVVGFAIAAVLLAAFAIFVLNRVWTKSGGSCHCFGWSPSPFRARHVVRNALLLAVALAAMAGQSSAAKAGTGVTLLAAVIGVTAGMCAVLMDDLAFLFGDTVSL